MHTEVEYFSALRWLLHGENVRVCDIVYDIVGPLGESRNTCGEKTRSRGLAWLGMAFQHVESPMMSHGV